MKQIVRKMILNLPELVEERLPESGPFEPIIVESGIEDKEWKMTKIWLKVEQAPNGIEHFEVKRGVYLEATDDMTQCHIMVANGTKKDVLDKLTNDSFVDKLISNAKQLDDFLCHPD